MLVKHFAGQLDEIRIWKVQRSRADILATRTMRLVGNEANLVAYWPLDEGNGDVVGDRSASAANGRLGTVVGSDAADPGWATESPF